MSERVGYIKDITHMSERVQNRVLLSQQPLSSNISQIHRSCDTAEKDKQTKPLTGKHPAVTSLGRDHYSSDKR